MALGTNQKPFSDDPPALSVTVTFILQSAVLSVYGQKKLFCSASLFAISTAISRKLWSLEPLAFREN